MKTGAVSSQWYAFATVVLWSSAFVFTKVALLSFSSTALGFLRCAIASVVLYAVLRCKGVRMLNWRELPRFTLSGALGFSIYLFIFNKGSETLTAATGCILIATAPIITALMASVVFRERFDQRWGILDARGRPCHQCVQRDPAALCKRVYVAPDNGLQFFYGNGDACGLFAGIHTPDRVGPSFPCDRGDLFGRFPECAGVSVVGEGAFIRCDHQ